MANLTKEKERIKTLSDEFTKTKGFNVFLGKYRIKKILEHSNGGTLLDLGCAYGKMTQALSSHFQYIVGVDGSQKLIEKARKEYSAPNVAYWVSLIEEFDIGKKFDVVLLSFILEHVAEPQKILQKASEFVKDDGKLFIMVPNAESLHRRVGRAMGIIKRLDELTPVDIQHGHRRVYTQHTLTSEIRGAGLKKNHIETFFIKPLSSPQMEELNPEICDALYEVSKNIPGLGSMIFVSCSKN